MSENTEKRRNIKTRTGVVVSDRMNKTIVVQLDKLVMHPIYKKFVRRRVKYKVHDEGNEARVGDTVLIEETRPISRHKRWRVKSITHRAA
ncbi:MAG: 30S ribosomal protein S17 [Myxococcales bacterium]|nr:30S ribosomal protein S17 [Myxococcales bacterium]